MDKEMSTMLDGINESLSRIAHSLQLIQEQGIMVYVELDDNSILKQELEGIQESIENIGSEIKQIKH